MGQAQRRKWIPQRPAVRSLLFVSARRSQTRHPPISFLCDRILCSPRASLILTTLPTAILTANPLVPTSRALGVKPGFHACQANTVNTPVDPCAQPSYITLSPALSCSAILTQRLPHPLVPILHSGLRCLTFTVPKSSSLMWPPPNSFFTVARVAAYSIFSRT